MQRKITLIFRNQNKKIYPYSHDYIFSKFSFIPLYLQFLSVMANVLAYFICK